MLEPEGRAKEDPMDFGVTLGVPFSLLDSPPVRVHLQQVLMERLLWVLRQQWSAVVPAFMELGV